MQRKKFLSGQASMKFKNWTLCSLLAENAAKNFQDIPNIQQILNIKLLHGYLRFIFIFHNKKGPNGQRATATATATTAT